LLVYYILYYTLNYHDMLSSQYWSDCYFLDVHVYLKCYINFGI